MAENALKGKAINWYVCSLKECLQFFWKICDLATGRGELDNGQLGPVKIGAVEISQKGLEGMKFHRGSPILPQDPPGAVRESPRFSVTMLHEDADNPSPINSRN